MSGTNPLLTDWDIPLGLPPFSQLEAWMYEPAFEAAMAQHLAEIDAIAASPAPPDFGNTVLALDRAGSTLTRVSRVFSNLCAAQTTPELLEVERTMAPKLAAHSSAVSLHEGVFARLDAVHAQREHLGLDPVQRRLVERYHLDFVRNGATLVGAARERVAQISKELAELQTAFSQHVLQDESSWYLVLETAQDRAGLPEWLLGAARSAAADLGLPEGTIAITLSRSLVTPFLEHSTRRDLRERAFTAWISRGENDGPTDNRTVIAEILCRRAEIAHLHGEATFTSFQLGDTMAATPEAVDGLLRQVWAPARAAALAEYETLQALARQHGDESVEAWDWRFWAERVREGHDLDDEQIKPYFALDSVLNAAFDCASRLFGVSFHERPEIETYHRDVRTFEVRDRGGELAGVFLSDNFARPTKRSGAWMSSYRLRDSAKCGAASVPVVANHNNFAKAEAGRPTLLSIDDARTLFHEFGHGLHGLLSESPYQRLAGTAVLRDFVELPSQLFEHWLLVPEILRTHARHADTGEPIPDDLVERIRASQRIGQGFATVEYCASALVDLALHQRNPDEHLDLSAFEREELARLGMPPAMVMRHRLTHFSHLFSSSAYASAYYVYLWAEVLDADAFDAFTEAGDPFDPETAARLHKYVYSSGNTIEPGSAYRAFRGHDPGIEPLLRGRGLVSS